MILTNVKPSLLGGTCRPDNRRSIFLSDKRLSRIAEHHPSCLSQIAQLPMHRDIDPGLSSRSSKRILGFKRSSRGPAMLFHVPAPIGRGPYFAYDLRNGRMSKAAEPQNSQEGSVSRVLSKNTLVQPEAYGASG